jgi:hypothetical protein
MNIEWNKVTWYSKIIAVILFVGTFFIGFWLGTMRAEKIYIAVPHIIKSKPEPTPASLQNNFSTSTMQKLLHLGVSQKCTYEFHNKTSNSFLVGYFSNGKARIDIQYTPDSQEKYQVITDDMLYTWDNHQNVGSKADLTTIEKAQDASMRTINESLKSTKSPFVKVPAYALNEELLFTCMPWIPDMQKFTIPSNIKFSQLIF